MQDLTFLTTREAAKLLNVSVTTICSMLKRGKLRGWKIGKSGRTSDWRISKKSLDEFIRQAT